MSQFRAMAGLGRSAVNVRLEKLRAAGLVDTERDGRHLRFVLTDRGRGLSTAYLDVFGDDLRWDPELAADRLLAG